MITTDQLTDVSPDISASGVSWAAIFAGAAGAAALSLILLILGTGLGFSAASPWTKAGLSAGVLATSSILWLAFTQIAASGIGGYLAGRLRAKWATLHTDEVYFRDTAHGLLAWAVATLAAIGLAGVVIGNVASGVASAGSAVATAAVTAGAAGAASGSGGRANASMGVRDYLSGMDSSLAYTIDALLRKDPTAADSDTDTDVSNRTTVEATRIFANALRTKTLPPADQTYLAQIVAKRTGLTQQEAERRVADAYNQTRTAISNAETSAKEAADKARKAAAYSALWLFITLLCGAFVACLTATMGGKRRDRVVHTKSYLATPTVRV